MPPGKIVPFYLRSIVRDIKLQNLGIYVCEGSEMEGSKGVSLWFFSDWTNSIFFWKIGSTLTILGVQELSAAVVL